MEPWRRPSGHAENKKEGRQEVTPFITIAVQCHNFQRRLAWMLSSLAQQSNPGLVAIDIACMERNGRPSTEALAEYFGSRIQTRLSVWRDIEQFQYRGLVRNRQLQECNTEWLMFGDCDMVYHPEYFARLKAELDEHHAAATYMLSSGRTSNPKEDTNALVDSVSLDPEPIVQGAYERADRLTKIRRRNVGAGFCQLINMQHAPHEGYYVRPQENKDWNWGRGSNPRSDMQFRKRIGRNGGARQALPDWFSKTAIHLNHDRDPDAGKHLETQR